MAGAVAAATAPTAAAPTAAAPAAAAAAAPAARAREKRKGVTWAPRRKAASHRSKMHERNRCATPSVPAGGFAHSRARVFSAGGRYREVPPDFVQLASTRPGLRQHLVGSGARATLNWKEPAACIELTKASRPTALPCSCSRAPALPLSSG